MKLLLLHVGYFRRLPMKSCEPTSSAAQNGLLFMETSALEASNVSEAFAAILTGNYSRISTLPCEELMFHSQTSITLFQARPLNLTMTRSSLLLGVLSWSRQQ